MEWMQVLMIVLSNLTMVLPLFLWSRSEARVDQRQIFALVQSIQLEIKDFHGRLCAIEERRRRE